MDGACSTPGDMRNSHKFVSRRVETTWEA